MPTLILSLAPITRDADSAETERMDVVRKERREWVMDVGKFGSETHPIGRRRAGKGRTVLAQHHFWGATTVAGGSVEHAPDIHVCTPILGKIHSCMAK